MPYETHPLPPASTSALPLGSLAPPLSSPLIPAAPRVSIPLPRAQTEPLPTQQYTTTLPQRAQTTPPETSKNTITARRCTNKDASPSSFVKFMDIPVTMTREHIHDCLQNNRKWSSVNISNVEIFAIKNKDSTVVNVLKIKFKDDAQSTTTVVDYLQNTYDYVPQLIVSHSLGSLAAFYWICYGRTPDGQQLPAFVNVSGRYRKKTLYESTKEWQKSFNEQGYYEYTGTVARKPVTFRIYLNDFERFANWDTAFVWHKFPSTTDVLTVHGMSDTTVPPQRTDTEKVLKRRSDALIYAKALGARRPGTHALHLMEGAGHTFTGHIDELIGSILEWWEVRRRGGLNTGIWLPHVHESAKL
ncbi:hypothetical protein JOM56_013658 [Amanita muscaria]